VSAAEGALQQVHWRDARSALAGAFGEVPIARHHSDRDDAHVVAKNVEDAAAHRVARPGVIDTDAAPPPRRAWAGNAAEDDGRGGREGAREIREGANEALAPMTKDVTAIDEEHAAAPSTHLAINDFRHLNCIEGVPDDFGVSWDTPRYAPTA
jgi:hypothetical protein